MGSALRTGVFACSGRPHFAVPRLNFPSVPPNISSYYLSDVNYGGTTYLGVVPPIPHSNTLKQLLL